MACMVGIVWMVGVVCKYVGHGMFDMTVCMVCMVGLVWHVWNIWYVWYVW